MRNEKLIRTYVESVRKHLAQHLREGVGVDARVVPSDQEGAVVVFEFTNNASGTHDTYDPVAPTVNAAVRRVGQRLVGGNIEAITFAGTNISMEPGRIVVIKGEDNTSEWDDHAAGRDVLKIVDPGKVRRP